MLSRLKLQTADFNLSLTSFNHAFPSNIRPHPSLCNLRFPLRRNASPPVRSNYVSASSSPLPSSSSGPSVSTHYISSVGSPSLQLSQWGLTNRHILVLNVVACAVAVSATWLFLSAIPTLLAFKRAAESLEKLMDVTREELPDTMAAVRLSGMEISDLTMELSDLGQEITQGVRSSTKAVRLAEERLRGLTDVGSAASVQVVTSQKAELKHHALAKRYTKDDNFSLGPVDMQLDPFASICTLPFPFCTTEICCVTVACWISRYFNQSGEGSITNGVKGEEDA
ncbi:hypothetical protein V6N11_039813 [Hibiscus sabdariffa]|uniref:Uncharacterized protein n=1 Tax=Hibiscus sabdariffa TaxID=183260 RepID=A0ABR2RFK2_9ROSI